MNTYKMNADFLPAIEKVPAAVLDYTFDWSAWLATLNDSIASYTVTVPAGITKTNDARMDKKIVAWLTGGAVGTSYPIRCRVTTTGGRTEERTIVINVIPNR